MPKLFRVPLVFLLLAACVGLFLRWHMVAPITGVNFKSVLHGHSHVMFLGWIFNTLFLAYVIKHVETARHRFFRILFYCFQVAVIGMMISFPLQGYGPVSIILSTVHTALAVVFIIRFFKETKGQVTPSVWCARASLLYFIMSAAGPFTLGYLMANNLGQSDWYYFAVYFYLHFQYNGFFILGVLSLFFQLLERESVEVDQALAMTAARWTAYSVIPAYFLSVLWADPGATFNLIGFLAAVAQVAGFIFLERLAGGWRMRALSRLSDLSRFFLGLAGLAFGVKLMLQLASAHPFVASLAYELRPVVIAYLHLVLVGCVSFFLLVWLLEMGYVNVARASWSLALLLAGFTGSEVVLIMQPWWSMLVGSGWLSSAHWLVIYSIAMVVAIAIFLSGFKADENHIHQ